MAQLWAPHLWRTIFGDVRLYSLSRYSVSPIRLFSGFLHATAHGISRHTPNVAPACHNADLDHTPRPTHTPTQLVRATRCSHSPRRCPHWLSLGGTQGAPRRAELRGERARRRQQLEHRGEDAVVGRESEGREGLPLDVRLLAGVVLCRRLDAKAACSHHTRAAVKEGGLHEQLEADSPHGCHRVLRRSVRV